ncbi:MAG: hypothetical protein PWQ59_1658 [Thermoanaerobacterium sp.]|nr:hypothetical protein [Thermoanaerobacterium sp.]
MTKIKSLEKRRNIKIKLFVQVFFFVTILLTAINESLSKKNITIPFISNASLHGLCPFGGVVSIYKFATEGSFVQKIHESSVVMLGIVVFLSILFGPVFCGWVCPLGSVQEWIGKLLFNDVDSYYALFNVWTGEVTIQAIILLIVVLVSSLFSEKVIQERNG